MVLNKPAVGRFPPCWRDFVALIIVIIIILVIGGVGLLTGIIEGILSFGILGVLLLALLIVALARRR